MMRDIDSHGDRDRKKERGRKRHVSGV